MKIYHLSFEPVGNYFSILLDFSLKFCSSFILVVRKNLEMNQSGNDVLNALNSFLIEKKDEREWPGTKLMKDSAYIYNFILNLESASVLKNNSKGLYEWRQPGLPEDLCFLRRNGSPLFVSITHENEAYFKVEEQEIQDIFLQFPDFGKIIRK